MQEIYQFLISHETAKIATVAVTKSCKFWIVEHPQIRKL